MVLHHSNDFPNDLGNTPPQWLSQWPWYCTTSMTFPMTLVLHYLNDFPNDLGTTTPQWLFQWPVYYTTTMTFPMTLVLHHPNDFPNDLDLDLDLDCWHYNHWPKEIQSCDSTISQWSYTISMTLTFIIMTIDLNLEHHHPPPPPSSNTHQHTPHASMEE